MSKQREIMIHLTDIEKMIKTVEKQIVKSKSKSKCTSNDTIESIELANVMLDKTFQSERILRKLKEALSEIEAEYSNTLGQSVLKHYTEEQIKEVKK